MKRELITDENPIKDFREIYADTFVDVNIKLSAPPLALSIGSHQFKGYTIRRRFGTYGNFSVIKGQEKTRKSFLKSLLVAAYIGGNTVEYAPDIKPHRKGNEVVLDFDTEQSKYDSENVFKRVGEMVDYNYDHYKPFSLRKLNFTERIEFIEDCILNVHKDNLGLVIIDGIADLASENNDEIQANLVVEKLMQWSDITQCHIIVIIHTNPNSEKATGHLGTKAQRKAETVCLTETDNDKTIVRFKTNRGYPIDDFMFYVDENGLPRTQELTQELY